MSKPGIVALIREDKRVRNEFRKWYKQNSYGKERRECSTHARNAGR